MNQTNSSESMNRIQNSIQSILCSFFTGAGISFVNKCLYPYVHYPFSIKKQIEIIEQTNTIFTESAEKEKLLSEIRKVKQTLWINSSDLACFISAYFQLLEKQKMKKSHQHVFEIKDINLCSYANDAEYNGVLHHLKNYGNNLREKGFGSLLLFGSLATKDYIKGHSDLDTVFIVSKETCMNPQKLLSLRKHITKIMKESYFIDPLQHHGPFIYTEFDLESFPQYYLPHAVWKNSVSLCGDIQVTIYERKAEQEIKDNLHRYTQAFQEIIATANKKKSLYARKFQYQVILLFPSIYLLAKGSPCYKQDSFELIIKYLNKEGNALLTELSAVRSKNLLKTSVAGISVQTMFRAIPHSFFYAFVYRVFHADKQIDDVQKLLEPGLRNMMQIIEEWEHEHK